MPPLMEVVRSLARRYHCPCSSLLQSTSGGGSRRWTPPMSAQASVAFPLAELPRRLDLRSRRRVQPRHQSFTLDLRLHHHHHHHHQQQQQQQQWIMKCFSTTATEEGKEAKCLPGKAAPGSGELSGDGVSVNRGDMPTGEAFLQEFLEYSRQKFIENRFLTSPYLQQKREILSFYRKILGEGVDFFDPVGADYIRWRARHMFRRYQFERNPARIKLHLRTARKMLRKLQLANAGDRDACVYVLEHAYGKKGKVKHILQNRADRELRGLRTRAARARRGVKFSVKVIGSESDFPPHLENFVRRAVEAYVKEISQLATGSPLPKYLQPNLEQGPLSKWKVGRGMPHIPPPLQRVMQEELATLPRWKRRLYRSTLGFRQGGKDLSEADVVRLPRVRKFSPTNRARDEFHYERQSKP